MQEDSVTTLPRSLISEFALSTNQQKLLNVIEAFIAKEALNLFIAIPDRLIDLTPCFLTLMATYKNEKSQFKQLVYIVDTQRQAKDAYTSFCKMTGVSKEFVVKGGKEGRYMIQFVPNGLIYRFIYNDKVLRGIGGKPLCLFNLALSDENPFLTPYYQLKSIWIMHRNLVSDPTWREEKMKNGEICFYLING